MKFKISKITLLLSALLAACVSNEDFTYQYNYHPTFTWGYAEFFGPYYSRYDINKNVVSLSLFTDSLTVNDDGKLSGFGQYLYFEDIFIQPGDTILPDGLYHCGSNYDAFTFTPGLDFMADTLTYTIGAYMVFVEKESSRSKLRYVKNGTITVNKTGSKQNINCHLILDNDSVVNSKFSSGLVYLDESVNIPKGVHPKKVNVSDFLNYP